LKTLLELKFILNSSNSAIELKLPFEEDRTVTSEH
jgi:hypothetical protein